MTRQYQMSKGQAQALARALRAAAWVGSEGNYEVTLLHSTGHEVSITVYAPHGPPAPKPTIGFKVRP